MNRFQEPYNEKSFRKIKLLKSLQKAVNILNSFIFSQYKFHHRSSTGLYISLWKYWDFQSEAKVEQIIAIVTTHSVSCYNCDAFRNLVSFVQPATCTTCNIPPWVFFAIFKLYKWYHIAQRITIISDNEDLIIRMVFIIYTNKKRN